MRVLPTSTPEFEARAQQVTHGPEVEQVQLSVWTEPAMSDDELRALARRIARLLARPPGELAPEDVVVDEDAPPPSPPSAPPRRPWWKFW